MCPSDVDCVIINLNLYGQSASSLVQVLACQKQISQQLMDFSVILFSSCLSKLPCFTHSFSPTLCVSLTFVHRDRVVSYTLGRRLPTDHVCGQLQFRFELSSSIHPGT